MKFKFMILILHIYTESLVLWTRRELRVLSSCLSILLQDMDYCSAIEIVHRMARLNSDKPVILRGLASILGKIYLQVIVFFSKKIVWINTTKLIYICNKSKLMKIIFIFGFFKLGDLKTAEIYFDKSIPDLTLENNSQLMVQKMMQEYVSNFVLFLNMICVKSLNNILDFIKFFF